MSEHFFPTINHQRFVHAWRSFLFHTRGGRPGTDRCQGSAPGSAPTPMGTRPLLTSHGRSTQGPLRLQVQTALLPQAGAFLKTDKAASSEESKAE